MNNTKSSLAMNINEYGFVRIATASPKLKVADCSYNIKQIKFLIDQALTHKVQILCFPELSITGYTCGDLFFQKALLDKALDSLIDLTQYLSNKPSIIVIVGLPLIHKNKLYNVAAVLSSEGIIGFVPKQTLPNHSEYYEKRWFTSGKEILDEVIETTLGLHPFSSTILFKTSHVKFGIEINNNIYLATPHSNSLAIEGADVIFNLSASNELANKNGQIKKSLCYHSKHHKIAYVYASAGVGESSTDLVFSGSSFIAENGEILTSSKRFSLENEIIYTDVDVLSLRNLQIREKHVQEVDKSDFSIIYCYLESLKDFDKLHREFTPHPFVPNVEERKETLEDIYNIQTSALAKRLLHTNDDSITLGVSGGLDSTLALLIAINTFDLLNLPRKNIHAITMPGFGTTERTYKNAYRLMEATGVTIKDISIVPAVTQHLKDIGHNINIESVTFENSQARERTQILMDYANKIGSIVLGTGNLSELALGWATYNGDHMSMYAINSGIPKTLVVTLVHWIAENHTNETIRETLFNIINTPFSPELLSTDAEGNIAQKTEDFVGPYELHDFFIHRMLYYNDNPRRVYFIAQQAFKQLYHNEEILKWLKVFYKRFFSQQFKRSCMPDGPKVCSISLSPRGFWRMPSDATVSLWIEELENI